MTKTKKIIAMRFVAMSFFAGLAVAFASSANAERVRGIEFDDPNHELVGWISYRAETPLLNPPFELPSGEVPFDYPARLETRMDGDGAHRVILSFAADLELGNRELRLVGWDKDNKSIPGIASKVQKVPGKSVLLVNAELVRAKGFADLRRLVLMSAKEGSDDR